MHHTSDWRQRQLSRWGSERAEAEPVTAVAEKVIMQNTEKTGRRTVKADPETVENELVWQMLG